MSPRDELSLGVSSRAEPRPVRGAGQRSMCGFRRVRAPSHRPPAPSPPRRTRAAHSKTRTSRAATRWGDQGVSMLEFAGFLPILLLIGMAAIQLGLVGYAINQAGSGARAAARVASQDGAGEAAGQAAMSDWLDANVSAPKGGDTTTATVTVDVPVLIPFVEFDWQVVRRATMPNDDDD